MKFHMLPIGARFEVRGKLYVKSGPLTANDESGGQQLFPRATMVNPIEDTPGLAPQTTAATLTPQAVREAFEAFETQCRRQLLRLAGALGEQQAETLAREIDAARSSFLSRLGLNAESR